MTTKEERKQRLKDRTRRAVHERGQTGLGKKTVLDYSKTKIEVIKGVIDAEKGKTRIVDIIPFVITQEWYKNLRTKSGTTTGLEVGDWDYKLEIPVHKNVGPDNKTILCLQQAFGRKCALCEDLYAEWDKDDSDQDQKKIDSLKSSWRCHYNAYDYDGESGKIELWDDISYFNFEDMLGEAMETDDEGLATFWDLDDGKSIQYKTRIKKIGKNSFHETHSIEFLDREPYGEDILAKVHPLDAMLIIPTEAEVIGIYNEVADEGSNETKSGSQDEPAQTRRTRRIDQEAPATTEKKEPDIPAAETVVCPDGGVFGKDCNSLAGCDICEGKTYAACQAAFVAMQDKGAITRERPTEKSEPAAEASPPRRRRRNI